MSKQSRRHLAEVIGERTLKHYDHHKLAQSIAAYLLEENITSDLESLIRDIMQYRLEHGVVEVRVVSAHELPKKVLDDVKVILRHEYPKAHNIETDTELDPKVIGGVRLDLPNEQLDLTVKARLDTFKRLTTGGA